MCQWEAGVRLPSVLRSYHVHGMGTLCSGRAGLALLDQHRTNVLGFPQAVWCCVSCVVGSSLGSLAGSAVEFCPSILLLSSKGRITEVWGEVSLALRSDFSSFSRPSGLL